MQNPEQGLLAYEPALPSRQTHQHKPTGQQRQQTSNGLPASHQGCHQQNQAEYSCHVQRGNGLYSVAVESPLAQPAGGKRRSDAATDNTDQCHGHDQGTIAEGHVEAGDKADLHQPKQAEYHHDHQLSFLPGVPDTPAGIHHHQGQECQVYSLNQPKGQVSTGCQQYTAGQPDAPEQHQSESMSSFRLGPNAHCG